MNDQLKARPARESIHAEKVRAGLDAHFRLQSDYDTLRADYEGLVLNFNRLCDDFDKQSAALVHTSAERDHYMTQNAVMNEQFTALGHYVASMAERIMNAPFAKQPEVAKPLAIQDTAGDEGQKAITSALFDPAAAP